MLGFYETLAEFEAAHRTGDPGDTYLVAGRLLTWSETDRAWLDLGSLVGPTGEAGEQGEKGPIAATIPFSIAGMSSEGATIACDADGNPSIVAFSGFGPSYYGMHTTLKPGEWEAGRIEIDYEDPYPATFIMPYDGTIKRLHILFANRTEMELETGITMRPFACLATSSGDTLAFTILRDTMTYTEPYIGDSEVMIPKYSLRKGSRADLDINLSESTLVGIFVGWVGEGNTFDISNEFSVSGGLYIE